MVDENYFYYGIPSVSFLNLDKNFSFLMTHFNFTDGPKLGHNWSRPARYCICQEIVKL